MTSRRDTDSVALPRIVWLLADGLSHELVGAYSAARPKSMLASLWRRQRVRALEPLSPNCQTPPSLFTIWSGCDVDVHGLTGYDLPVSIQGDPTEFVAAFDAWPRHLNMLWDHYADEKRPVRTCAVPFVQPERLGPWLLSATDVFRPALVSPCVLGDGEELLVPALSLQLIVRVRDGEAQLLDADGKRAWGSSAQEAAVLLPARAGRCEHSGDTHLALRVRAAEIDGCCKVVVLGYHPIAVHGTDAARRKLSGRWLPYVIGNPGKLYASSALGLRLDEGGQGHAETLLLRLMRDVHDGFASDIALAVDSRDADLVVGYYPVIDLLSHQLLKHAVSPAGRFDGPLADAFLTALDWLDELIVKVGKDLPEEMRFVIHSDHGMSPVRWDVYPNRHFHEQGWLQCRANGRIDADRSLAFFHPAENGLLVFHRQRLRDAGMAPDDIIHSLSRAVACAGLPGLDAFVGPPAPLGSDWQADLYLRCPTASRPRASLDAELVQHSPKGGDHTVCASDPWLYGALLDAGACPALEPGNPEESLRLVQLLPLLTEPTAARVFHSCRLT